MNNQVFSLHLELFTYIDVLYQTWLNFNCTLILHNYLKEKSLHTDGQMHIKMESSRKKMIVTMIDQKKNQLNKTNKKITIARKMRLFFFGKIR